MWLVASTGPIEASFLSEDRMPNTVSRGPGAYRADGATSRPPWIACPVDPSSGLSSAFPSGDTLTRIGNKVLIAVGVKFNSAPDPAG